MNVKQVDIYYNDNSPAIFEALFKPIQTLMNAQLFSSWSISREWTNGPHFRLLLNSVDFFYTEALVAQVVKATHRFLLAHPSPEVDVSSYQLKQKKLMAIEKVDIDPNEVHINNTVRVSSVSVEALAAKYESQKQWKSVFDANCEMRPILIELGRKTDDAEQKEKQLFHLMMLLAAIYQPKPNTADELDEYNGFLSYFSNYTFWHHSLSENAQQHIHQTFSESYEARQTHYLDWLNDLTSTLGQQQGLPIRYAAWLKCQFRRFTQMVCDEEIHWRSPYPKEQLADINTVSPFHQKFFFNENGKGSPFPTDFSSYRWLLNIVYRLFPTLNFTPLDRQRLNYSLARFERENRKAVYTLRNALYQCG